MKSYLRWIGLIAASGLGLPLLAMALLMILGNSDAGKAFVEKNIVQWTDGAVRLQGITGRFPDSLQARRIELADTQGIWLSIENQKLDWRPSYLVLGKARIDRLDAGKVMVLRRPEYPPGPASTKGPVLPLRIEVSALHVDRLELQEPVLGKPWAFMVDANANLASLNEGKASIMARRLDGEGDYRITGHIEKSGIHLELAASEPPLGFLSSIAGLPELGAVSLHGNLDGPTEAAKLRLELAAGQLKASAQGSFDLVHEGMDVSASLLAPAMKPRPDVSWKGMALEAKIEGPFATPKAEGQLNIGSLQFGEASFRDLTAQWDADGKKANLAAKLEGLRLPGPNPGLFETHPLALEVHALLDSPMLPVDFSLSHPLLAIQGRLETKGALKGTFHLNLPKLAPLGSMVGQQIAGSSEFDLNASMVDKETSLQLEGKLGIGKGKPPLPALVGEAAKVSASLKIKGNNMALENLKFEGKGISFEAKGSLSDNLAELDYQLGLPNLALLTPTVSGPVSAKGKLKGPLDNFAATVELSGKPGVKGMAPEPIAANLQMEGLPKSPKGRLKADWEVAAAPLGLDLGLQSRQGGGLLLAIERADWKSAHAQGSIILNAGKEFAGGKIEIAMKRLEDLRPLTGKPLTGSFTAKLEHREAAKEALLEIEARDAGLEGALVIGQGRLSSRMVDFPSNPRLEGWLALDHFKAGFEGGQARLDWMGTLDALKLEMSGNIPKPEKTGMRLAAKALLNAKAKSLLFSELDLAAKGEKLNLASPFRVEFADGVLLSPMRLSMRQGTFEMEGRIAPNLDLGMELRNIPASLAGLFSQELSLDGILQADAKLTGTAARPVGAFRIEAKAIRQRKGPAAGLPPANLNATANLAGDDFQINAHLNAGPLIAFSVEGQASTAALGPLAMKAAGNLDLKAFDPVLAAAGRRMRGIATLDAQVEGTLSAPEIKGSLRLAKGDIEDYPLGIHVDEINALLEASGGTIRIDHLQGRAGPGFIKVGGSIMALRPGLPLNLSISARNARPLASDRLSVNLNTDLNITGEALGALNIEGGIHINHAEINIPERLPPRIAVLNVRNPAAPTPPPAPKAAQPVAVNLNIDAPGEIFVRGRGLDAELGGKVKVQGTAGNPIPEGQFSMRRGSFSLAGQTLTFSKGEVGFNGGSLSDPSLNFIASKSNGAITAILMVGGTARKPKITLQAIPELPQDEVLAQLLFANSTSNLSPFELAQIASALASLTGVTSGLGNPLEDVRKGLGLDRLSMGGGKTGPTLEAGRYVAPGIYVGAKQGISATSTQGTVQIDITKRLKLEGSIGTGSPTTTDSGSGSVGVLYQYEY